MARHVHAINVTDNQSAVMKLGSLAASVRPQDEGIEPIFQMTCRDRNRIALQSDLLSACSLGDRECPLPYGGSHKARRPQIRETRLRHRFRPVGRHCPEAEPGIRHGRQRAD